MLIVHALQYFLKYIISKLMMSKPRYSVIYTSMFSSYSLLPILLYTKYFPVIWTSHHYCVQSI